MDIYTKFPINKSAATVVSQSGCTSHEGFSDDQQRNILIKRYQFLVHEITKGPKYGGPYESMRKEAIDIGSKLREYKIRYKRGFEHYLLDVIKEKTSKAQWDIYIKEAKCRFEKTEKSGAVDDV